MEEASNHVCAMSRNDSTDAASSRRAILKGVGAGATGLAVGSGFASARRTENGSGDVASAGAEPQNCYTESRCLDETCDDDSTGCQYQWRDCCNYGTGYECETWNDGGCCNC